MTGYPEGYHYKDTFIEFLSQLAYGGTRVSPSKTFNQLNSSVSNSRSHH